VAFFACETWFDNALPKAVKTSLKAILLIIIHTVGGILRQFTTKINLDKLDGNLQLMFAIAAKVEAMI